MDTEKLVNILKPYSINIPQLDSSMYKVLQEGGWDKSDEMDQYEEKFNTKYALLLNGVDKYVLKVAAHEDARVNEELLREAYIGIFAIPQLQSPNFANIFGINIGTSCYDIDPQMFCDYILYEYIEGETLNDFLRIHKPSETVIKKILREIFLALYEAYKKISFVHGDLHGDNIIIKPDGTPVIIDYGASEYIDTKTLYPIPWDEDIEKILDSVLKHISYSYSKEFVKLITYIRDMAFDYDTNDYDTFIQEALQLLQ